jgi:hypothetical protein
VLDQWRGWLMPAQQPFLVPRDVAQVAGLADDGERLSFELKDTFWLYDLGDRAVCCSPGPRAAACRLRFAGISPPLIAGPHRIARDR